MLDFLETLTRMSRRRLRSTRSGRPILVLFFKLLIQSQENSAGLFHISIFAGVSDQAHRRCLLLFLKSLHVGMICRISLLLVLTTCASGSFVVNVTQTSYQAEENHNITLEWTFTVETGRFPQHLIIYCELIKTQRISVLYHVHNGAEVSESQDEKFSGRVQSDKDALREGRIRLQLCRLRTEDSGRYRCQINTDYGFSSASCRLNVTAAADQRSTSPPQEEEREDWKNILIVLTAAAALLTLLMVCTSLWVMLRKKQKSPSFCTAVKIHKFSGTESQKQDTSCL